jgi:predicted N-acetyltransferase YhbS
MNLVIRAERPGDEREIAELIIAAFEDLPYSSHTEHLIVDALRAQGQLAVSLVADDDGEIIGHVAASPVLISDGSAGWYGIGPVSVWPSCQGRGIGSQLMREALAVLQRLGAQGCVLLGDPDFYGRFGFVAETGLVLPGVPAEYFQAMVFIGDCPVGEVSYSSAFSVGPA